MNFMTLSIISANQGISTYLAKYLNILDLLSKDTLPFMLTYFFEVFSRLGQPALQLPPKCKDCTLEEIAVRRINGA